ncbi:MAG: OmpA family protein [Alcanivoracaceae bacterium]|jgi:OOP family OmpA-OmpF porin|nr:OmpA family protein [Alcanivoracaceae bacterium]
MKKLVILASLTALTSSVTAEHNVPANYGYLGVHLTSHFFDITDHGANADLDTGLLPGGQFGLRFKDQWSLQAWLEEGDLGNATGAGDFSFTHYFISARHHYRAKELFGFEPYTGAAIGHQEIEDSEDTLGAFELGLQRGLGKRFILDLGARPAYSFDNERWDGQVYAAINLVIGASTGGSDSIAEVIERNAEQGNPTEADMASQAVSALAAQVDGDSDGIVDALDKCLDTKPGAKVDDSGCNIVMKEDIRETLYVQFTTGGSAVSEASIDEIGRVAQRMIEYPDAQLVIEGHTDSSGSADLNRRLSQQRADAVKQILTERFSVDSARIEAVGRGEDAPAFTNDTAEGRAKNRRVEAVLQAQRIIKQ